MKIQNKFFFFFFFWGGVESGGGGGSSVWGVQGRCEQRSKVFVKIQKKMGGVVRSGGGAGGSGGQGGCERKIEFFCEN